MKYETPIQTLINIARDDDYPTGLCEQAEAELVQKDEALRLAREAVARLESIIRAARHGEYNNANEINAIRKFLSESMQEYYAALAKATP